VAHFWGECDRTLRRDLALRLDGQFTNPPRKVFFPDVGYWVIEAPTKSPAW